MLYWITLLTLLFSFTAQAEFGLTNNLTTANRKQILEVLGLGASGKNVSIPGGLGSEHGLEISIANEFIDTQTITQFITNSDSQHTLYYPKISIGKGLYDRVDLFIHFIPYTATLGLSEFGGSLRVHFFKPTDSKLSSAIVVGMNSASFNNQLTTRGLHADISLGMNWEHISVFSSFGVARSVGTFIGGTLGTTDSLNNESEEVSEFHYSVGTLYKYKMYFVSAALDHYTQPVYTLKVGCYF